MKNYTWIEFPTWILAQLSNPKSNIKINTNDFILIANISSKVDESGYINPYDFAKILFDLEYSNESILGYLGTNGILSTNNELEGFHLNFFDNKQDKLLNIESIDKEDRISRLAFPLELTKDERLSLEDFRFLAFCFEFSKLRNGNDYSFIDWGAVKVFTDYFGLRHQNIRKIITKLESLGYVNLTEEGLELLPEKNRKKVFVSYSHKDREFLDDIKIHFKPFLTEIDFWDDSIIEPSQKWREEIKNAISETKVAILLVSANFLASDFISKDELPPLLRAAKDKGVAILIVILKPCLFEEFPELNQFQAMNPPNKPVAKLDDIEKDELYVNLVKQTKRILNIEAV